jgi:hypothetical protein
LLERRGSESLEALVPEHGDLRLFDWMRAELELIVVEEKTELELSALRTRKAQNRILLGVLDLWLQTWVERLKPLDCALDALHESPLPNRS